MSVSLRGTVNLPGSKSESNRALMIAAYGGFPIEVDNLSDAHDTVLLKQMLGLTSLRAERSGTRQSTVVNIVDCEDAGTVARFLLTYLAGKPGNWLLTGTERLCQRPMAPLIDALRQLGATIIGEGLPLRIIGKPINGGRVVLDASKSSQFASSLLLAAPTWEQGLQLTLTDRPVSMPYLVMTLKMMEHFGVQAITEGNTIMVKHQPYQQRPFTVSADWSAASYWYEMMALSDGGELLLKGLSEHSLQGDVIVSEWFKPLGVATTFCKQGARLKKVALDSQGLAFDFTDHPDLFPAVYVTCKALHVDAVFNGLSTLTTKESDRLKALQTELDRIPSDTTSLLPVFRTFNDHRVAMALAALWPVLGTITVDDPSVVAKSYPGFWKELSRLI